MSTHADELGRTQPEAIDTINMGLGVRNQGDLTRVILGQVLYSL